MITPLINLRPPRIVVVLIAVAVVLFVTPVVGSAQDPSNPYPDGDPSGYGFDENGGGPPVDKDALPPANLTTGPTPMAVWQLVQPDWRPLRQEIDQLVAASKMPVPPRVEGPTLRNEAHVAFRYGHLPLAHELFFAHVALADEQALEDLKKLQFCAYFRRPVWALRWGVSIGLHGDTDVTSYSPIRIDGSSDGRGMGMDEFGGGMEDFDDPRGGGRRPGERPGQGPPDDMMMDEEMMMEEEMMMGYDDEFGRSGERGTAKVEASIPDPQVTDPAITERFDDLMGAVASTVAEGMRSRIEKGQFGHALTEVDPEAKDQGYMVGGESVPQAETRMWIPGVVYLGEGSIQEMSKAAVQANIELLLHFDVALKEVRGGTTQNLTRVKVLDCKNGKTVVLSGAMDSREVQRLQQTNRGTAESHLTEALEKFWSIIDSKIAVTPFPQLTPEVARRRVTGLLADSSLSPLRKLAEIRFLGVSGWLTEEEVEQAFDIAIGADGMTVLYGSPADAIEILRELALQNVSQSP
ncbi:hypothetical protein FHS27_001413 [Rhodopirellula rubra]|uniref:Uncharacterized protein n=1 Tax=Aporhodopirellula rubra TaxID=980271 RepID=A0A7W5DWS9_9BACT|nr:hypothetical protein [Aporhodopirellula rubra]MBB3205609.1 hypothetical protein [Aporhodopirellula rubra]